MRGRRMYYKVILLEIDSIESSIKDERNFGTREEARTWAREVDPEGYSAKIYMLPRDEFQIAV